MSLVEFITFNSESRLFKKICRSVRLSVQLSFVCFDGPNLSFKLRFYQKQEWQHDFVVYVLVVFYFVLFFYFYFLLKPKAGFSISFQNLEFDNFGRCCDFDWCVYLLANDELYRRLPEEGRKKRLRDGSNQHQQVDHDKNKRRKFHKISFQKNNFKQKKIQSPSHDIFEIFAHEVQFSTAMIRNVEPIRGWFSERTEQWRVLIGGSWLKMKLITFHYFWRIEPIRSDGQFACR